MAPINQNPPIIFRYTHRKTLTMKRQVILLLASLLLPGILYAESPDEWVDVSHGLGVPLGALGSGYSVFGKYGFVRMNFDDRPDPEEYKPLVPGADAYCQEPSLKAPFGFILDVEGESYALQSSDCSSSPVAKGFDSVEASVLLPKGRVAFRSKELPLVVSVLAWTPLVPHDLATASTPTQLFDISIKSTDGKARDIVLKLAHAQRGQPEGNRVVFSDNRGQLALAARDGTADAGSVCVKLAIPATGEAAARFAISWYYPKVFGDTRYYAKTYSNASEVSKASLAKADAWKQQIEAWHDSIQTPAYFKRLWFSSLASVMTSTILTDARFYEIETPHGCLNTMDVNAYSGWVYLINWPEIEKLDMQMYLDTIPKSGSEAGFVWHSYPNDRADYVEEPTFLVRCFRDQLWFNDPAFTKDSFAASVLAANRVYRYGNFDFLINSPGGNQSYDAWKMPGVSSYVNSPWIYGLFGLARLDREMGAGATVAEMPVAELQEKSLESFNRLLWNETNGVWDCYFSPPGVTSNGDSDALFTDQLFGKWMMAIDPQSDRLLSGEKVRRALESLYENNLVEDATLPFRGWCNGMLPGRVVDADAGYHSRVFWFGPQLVLGSLLGLAGNEEASLDVFRSVEMSLRNNHLAAGEWNQSVDANRRVSILASEPGKDTPRFAPYPRYKVSWEYLIRLLGLQLDRESLYLKPFKTVDFSLERIVLAGETLTVNVQSGWTRAEVDGKSVSLPVELGRTGSEHRIEFIR
jgi:uncharacterized protein (DUF608 family)